MNGDVIPVVDVFFCSLDEFELLLGVVDEGAQLPPFRLADVAFEQLGHLAADVSRGILQHMLEGLALAVQVGQEVLRALGQVQDGFEIDNLGGR